MASEIEAAIKTFRDSAQHVGAIVIPGYIKGITCQEAINTQKDAESALIAIIAQNDDRTARLEITEAMEIAGARSLYHSMNPDQRWSENPKKILWQSRFRDAMRSALDAQAGPTEGDANGK